MGIAVTSSLIWLAAFLCALMPFNQYEAESFLAAFLLIAFAFIEAMLRQGGRLKPDLLIVLGFGFWALAFISVCFSEVPFVSFIYFCFFSAMPLTFLLPFLLQDKERFFKYVAYGLGGIFAALGIFTIIEFFTMPKWLNHGSAHWPLTDPNSFAGMYSLAFFCSFGLMLAGRTRAESNAGLLLSLLFMCCIFMSGSKGALFLLLGALAVFVFMAWPQVKKHRRCCSILLAGSAAMFVALVVLASSPQQAFWLKYSTEYGLYPRNALLSGAWNIGLEHFWTGTGIGTFFMYYPAYRGVDKLSAGFMAHSDPLQFFSEMGVLAPLIFYAFIIAAMIRTFAVLRTRAPDDVQRVHILAPFCGLGAFAVHSHFNFPFNILPLLMLAGLLLSFWYVRTQDIAEIRVFSKNARAIAAFAVLLCAGFFAAVQSSEILTNTAQQKINEGDLNGFMHAVNAADRLGMHQNARALVMAAAIPLGILESSQDLSKEEKQEYRQRVRDLLDRAGQINPRLAAVPYYKARLYARSTPKGVTERPVELLNRALVLDPMHRPSRQLLADLWARQGRKKEALMLMKEGLKWPGATPEYYEALAKLAKLNGDMDLHDTMLAKMLIGHGAKLASTFRQGELRSYGVLE